jgi:DNA processing protein
MDYSRYLSEKEALYGCLASQHDLGYAGFGRLMEHFGSPEGVYGGTVEEWQSVYPRLSDAMAASLSQGPRRDLWEGLVESCAAHRIEMTAPVWEGYPDPLRELSAPPPLLYLRGRWQAEDAQAVALVGTRTPTAYGREAAFTLARDLAEAGCTIVSGLALGIDAAAHAGALSPEIRNGKGGRTIAVIGCGLDIEYPLENLPIRARIEEEGGAHGVVLTEFPPGTQPLRGHFPRRNRLISALARAVVVVEAGSKSGALLTATHAHTQGKPLFAVPGPIFSSVSVGTNTLLRKGALVAASPEDVLRVLEIPSRVSNGKTGSGAIGRPALLAAPSPRRWRTEPARIRKPVPSAQVTEPEASAQDPILKLWGEDAVCGLDQLVLRAGERSLWPEDQIPAALLESLLRLEMRGKVRRLPGASFQRTIGRA